MIKIVLDSYVYRFTGMYVATQIINLEIQKCDQILCANTPAGFLILTYCIICTVC